MLINPNARPRELINSYGDITPLGVRLFCAIAIIVALGGLASAAAGIAALGAGKAWTIATTMQNLGINLKVGLVSTGLTLTVISVILCVALIKIRPEPQIRAHIPRHVYIPQQDPVYIPQHVYIPRRAYIPQPVRVNLEEGYVEDDFGSIKITVKRSSIENNPSYHLNELVKCINVQRNTERYINGNVSLSVKYLRNDLSEEEGVGIGLVKDYISSLFLAIMEEKSLSFALLGENNLQVPTASKKDEVALKVYEQLGAVMGFVLDKFVTGVHFHDSLFTLALNFTADELDASFEGLSFERKLDLAALLAEKQNLDKNYFGSFQILINAYNNWDFKKISGEVKEALKTLDFEFEETEKDIKECVKTGLEEFITSMETQLRGIHAVAKGIKSACKKGCMNVYLSINDHWNTYRQAKTPEEFSKRLQGSVDKETVVASIKYSEDENAEVQKKAEWLKSWLLHEATKEELHQFLMFVAGGSLIENATIAICGSDTKLPFPKVHVCSIGMDLSNVPATYGNDSNDHTKENFIKCVKSAIQKKEFDSL